MSYGIYATICTQYMSSYAGPFAYAKREMIGWIGRRTERRGNLLRDKQITVFGLCMWRGQCNFSLSAFAVE